MTHALETFFDAWADGNADAVEAAAMPDIHYQDPGTPDPLHGTKAVADYISLFAQHVPGATAKVAHMSEVGGAVRVTIAFRMPDGMEKHGQYFADLSEDGRIARLIGFVGMGTPE